MLRYKGTKPVMTQEERWNTIKHCRYVDEVYKCPPFYPTLEFINEIKVQYLKTFVNVLFPFRST